MKFKFVLSVWETERRYPISRWVSARREPSDPPRFTNREGSVDAVALEAVEAAFVTAAQTDEVSLTSPNRAPYVFDSPWTVANTSEQKDSDGGGWEYALDFKDEFSSNFCNRWSWVRRREHVRTGTTTISDELITSRMGPHLSNFVKILGEAPSSAPQTPVTPCSDVEPVFESGGNSREQEKKKKGNRSFPESSSEESLDDLVPEPSANVRSRAPPPKLVIPSLKLDGMKATSTPPPSGGIFSDIANRLTPRILQQHSQRQHVAVIVTPRETTPRLGGLSAPTSARSTATEITWVKDSDAPNCSSCTSKFTVFVRRHHCRMCGQVFCNECCKVDSEHGKMRICIHCLAEEATRALEEQQVLEEIARMEREMQDQARAREFPLTATLELEVKLRLELCSDRTRELEELLEVERGERLALLAVQELQDLPPVEKLELTGMFNDTWRSALRGRLFISLGPLRCRSKGTVKVVDGNFFVSYNSGEPISVAATVASELPTKQPKEVELQLDGESDVLVISAIVGSLRRSSLFSRRGSQSATSQGLTCDFDLAGTLLPQPSGASSRLVLTSVVSGTSLITFPSVNGAYETVLRYRFEPTATASTSAGAGAGAGAAVERQPVDDLSAALSEVFLFRAKRLELDRSLEHSGLVSDERSAFATIVQLYLKETGLALKLTARRAKQRELAPKVKKILADACKALAGSVMHVWYAQMVRNTPARQLAQAKWALEEKARKQAEALLVHQHCIDGPNRIVVVSTPTQQTPSPIPAVAPSPKSDSPQPVQPRSSVQLEKQPATHSVGASPGAPTINIDQLFEVKPRAPPKAKSSKCCSVS